MNRSKRNIYVQKKKIKTKGNEHSSICVLIIHCETEIFKSTKGQLLLLNILKLVFVLP